MVASCKMLRVTCEKAKDRVCLHWRGRLRDAWPFVPNGGAEDLYTMAVCGLWKLREGLSTLMPFILSDGIAVVDKEACKACGKCVAKCPRHLIELIPYDQKVAVDCSSHDKGKQVDGLPVRLAVSAVRSAKRPVRTVQLPWTDFCAHIDYEKCTGCGAM